jgi:hypothetical protein
MAGGFVAMLAVAVPGFARQPEPPAPDVTALDRHGGRNRQLGLGPAAVIVKMTGPFVLGGLITQLWTYAHADTYTKINQFLLQPFVNYNFGQGWALSFAPIIVANWDQASGNV